MGRLLDHRLHLAPVGAGKTARLLSLLRALPATPRAPLPKVWALTATKRQELRFRQSLTEGDAAAPVYFNIELFNFYSLNARLLKLAGKPVRRLSALARLALLRRMLADMQAQGQLEYFDRIAETRGFVAILADLIDELKQGHINEDEFEAAADSVKDREIAQIYRRYQNTLRDAGLADVEGEGWLALATLRARRGIVSQVDMLLVDGYDQFTPVQAQLLAQLAQTIPRLHITLTDFPESAAEMPPQRSALARDRLHSAFAAAGLELRQDLIAPAADRHPDLARLAKGVFRHAPPSAAGSVEAIRLIAMPSPAEEVKSVLRAIKRQLLAGVQPEDMLIAVRDWERYAIHLESGRQEYSLPLRLRHERALRSTPVIATLIDLLELGPHFRRRDLLDALRSPYIDSGLDDEFIDLLERLSRARRFTGGSPSAWLEFISLAGQAVAAGDDDPQPTLLSPERLQAQIARLAAFFACLNPPDRADCDTYVAWLEGLLGIDQREGADSPNPAAKGPGGSLNILERATAAEDSDDAVVQRDEAALQELRRILRDFSARDDVLRATFDESEELDWRRFRADLLQALESTAACPAASRAGQILVTTAAEARGLPHKHVYIPGLSEGVFPAEIAEDPLYLDTEREILQERGIPLAAPTERVDDQGLFYELISLPRETLTLSRPSVQAGKAWLESRLWAEVKRVFPDLPIESRAVGAVIPPEEAANGPELLLALADQFNGGDLTKASDALRMKAWMQGRADYAAQWRRIETGRRVERGRLAIAPFDHHSGILSRPALLGAVARELGQDKVWSATQLKDYALCGFRYFARRLLRLDASEEPEAGIDALQYGQLCHRILEATYRRIRTRDLAIEEANQERALCILDELSADLLRDAPGDLGFIKSASWDEEARLLRKRLAAMIKLDFSGKSPLHRFGERRRVFMLERYFKDARIEMPGDMPPLRVSGFIDRIDWVDDELVLVDYKSGSGGISRRQMEDGRDFQMFVYALAMDWAERHSPSQSRLSGGMFWHLRNLKTSGLYSADDEKDQAAIESARGHLALYLRRGRNGQFPVHAAALEDGKCARYCEFSHLCRRHVTNPHKSIPQV